MASIIKSLNDSLTTTNYTDPYNSSQFIYGQFVDNHMTNVSISYKPHTLSTPWPYLLISLIVSLLVAIYGLWSSNEAVHTANSAYRRAAGLIDDKKVRKDRRNRCTYLVFDIASVTVSTIRSATAFTGAILAVHNSGGRFQSPMLLFSVIASMVPLYLDDRRHKYLRVLIFIDLAMMVLAHQIMVYNRFFNKNNFYSAWTMSGGECAIPVKTCPIDFIQVGCGLNDLKKGDEARVKSYDFNKIYGPNSLASADYVMGIVANLGGGITIFLGWVAFYMVSLCCIWIGKLCRRIRTGSAHSYQRTDSPEHLELDSKPTLYDKMLGSYLDGYVRDQVAARDFRTYSVWAVYYIILTAAIALPLHAILQQRPKPVWVVDSYGPLAGYDHAAGSTNQTYTNITTGSWSDCFQVTPVHDELGFLEFWWNNIKNKPLEYLPGV